MLEMSHKPPSVTPLFVTQSVPRAHVDIKPRDRGPIIINICYPYCGGIDVACATKVLPRPPYLERLFTELGTYKNRFGITGVTFSPTEQT